MVRKIFLYIAVIFSPLSLQLNVPLGAEAIEDFFITDDFYTEYSIHGLGYPGGGYINYEVNGWQVIGNTRAPAFGNLLLDFAVPDLVSSNQIQFTLSDDETKEYVVRGIEAFFTRKVPLSELGYRLSNDDDVESEYYLIGFLRSTDIQVEMRFIAFLTDSYEFSGEIVSGEGAYFVRGIYKSYNLSRNTFVNSPMPSLVFIDRLNQTTMAITTFFRRTALWTLNELSREELLVVNFSTAMFQTMRFLPKRGRLLITKRENFLKNLEETDDAENIIDERFIIPPEQLGVTEENEEINLESEFNLDADFPQQN